MDQIASRPATETEPVEQHRAMGIHGNNAVHPDAGVPVAGGAHGMGDARGGAGGNARHPATVRAHLRGVAGCARDSGREKRTGAVSGGRADADRGGVRAGRRARCAGGHEPPPGPELRQDVRRDVSGPGKKAQACVPELVGAIHARHRPDAHATQR